MSSSLWRRSAFCSGRTIVLSGTESGLNPGAEAVLQVGLLVGEAVPLDACFG